MINFEKLFPRTSWRRIYIYRPIKHWWQRRTRGFDDSELWCLEETISDFALPRLKAFKDQYSKMGYPSAVKVELGYDMEDYEEGTEEACVKHWQWIIGEMIWFLEADTWGLTKAEQARLEEASTLWGRYFKHLWD